MSMIDKAKQFLCTNKNAKFSLFLLALVLLSLLMILIYGPTYNHPGYDYYFHLKRFEALITALREGSFPFYIDHNAALGYGYLSKVFYSDIILIPFALLGLLIGAASAFEVMLFTMTILCGIFMYVAIKGIYKNSFVASLSALLYTFSVYRLFDIYNRGALGEVFAFTFLPIVFLGLYHIIRGDYKKWYIIAIGFSLLIFSHVISTVLTFLTVVVILLIYSKFLIKEPKRFYFLVVAGIVTIAITSSYIFPLFEQIQSNTFRYENDDWSLPSRTKLPLEYWLWSLFCGFIYPKNIGIVGLGILLSVGILLRFFVKEKSSVLKSVDIGVIIGLVYIIATSAVFPWGRFPFTLLSFIQYPTRLYLFVTFFFSVAVAYYLSVIFKDSKDKIVVVSIILIGITICMHSNQYKYMHTTYINDTNEVPSPGNFFYLNGAEYVPEKASSAYFILEKGDSVRSLSGIAGIIDHKRERGVSKLNVATLASDSLELPLFYYKGYSATLNDENIAYTQSEYGLMQILIDKSGEVKVFYKGTTIQKISFFITIISIFVLCFYIVNQNRKNKQFKSIHK